MQFESTSWGRNVRHPVIQLFPERRGISFVDFLFHRFPWNLGFSYLTHNMGDIQMWNKKYLELVFLSVSTLCCRSSVKSVKSAIVMLRINRGTQFSDFEVKAMFTEINGTCS